VKVFPQPQGVTKSSVYVLPDTPVTDKLSPIDGVTQVGRTYVLLDGSDHHISPLSAAKNLLPLNDISIVLESHLIAA